MTELILMLKLIKTLHNCANHEQIIPQRWMILFYKSLVYEIQLYPKIL